MRFIKNFTLFLPCLFSSSLLATESAQLEVVSYESAFIKTMLFLVGFILLVGITIWTLRRLSHNRLAHMNHLKSIKILEKRPISPKSILYLIEVAGEKVLLAESQIEIKKITTLKTTDKEKDL